MIVNFYFFPFPSLLLLYIFVYGVHTKYNIFIFITIGCKNENLKNIHLPPYLPSMYTQVPPATNHPSRMSQNEPTMLISLTIHGFVLFYLISRTKMARIDESIHR